MNKQKASYLLTLAVLFGLIPWTSAATTAQTPKTAEDYNNRGLIRQNRGDLDGAIADYTTALSLKAIPVVKATAYNNRANAYMAKNNLTAAIDDYSRDRATTWQF